MSRDVIESIHLLPLPRGHKPDPHHDTDHQIEPYIARILAFSMSHVREINTSTHLGLGGFPAAAGLEQRVLRCEVPGGHCRDVPPKLSRRRAEPLPIPENRSQEAAARFM